ncbi:MAG: low molecular weight protein-tyrosine-phosphatase [Gammaproteobacteria bacterium]
MCRTLLEREGENLGVEVDSAGTHGYHTGEPPDPRAMEAAARRGIDMTRLRARVVQEGDFARFDLVLAMDEQILRRLHRLAPAEHRHRLKLFLEYAPALGRRDVPDPYYGGDTGFEQVLDLVEEAARGLLAALRQAR